MDAAPEELDGAAVIYYAVLSEKHRRTGAFRHFVGGQLIGAVPALAVCRYEGEGAAYLFHCSGEWEVITDDLFASAEEALEQAAVQYEGLDRGDWVPASGQPPLAQPTAT
jgi:hypothetical protein